MTPSKSLFSHFRKHQKKNRLVTEQTTKVTIPNLKLLLKIAKQYSPEFLRRIQTRIFLKHSFPLFQVTPSFLETVIKTKSTTECEIEVTNKSMDLLTIGAYIRSSDDISLQPETEISVNPIYFDVNPAKCFIPPEGKKFVFQSIQI